MYFSYINKKSLDKRDFSLMKHKNRNNFQSNDTIEIFSTIYSPLSFNLSFLIILNNFHDFRLPVSL